MRNRGNYVPREISVRGLEGHWLSGGNFICHIKRSTFCEYGPFITKRTIGEDRFIVCLCYVLISSQVNMMMRKVTINPFSSLLF